MNDDEPRLVALREHRRKSIIPPVVGGLSFFAALFLMAVAAMMGLYLFIFLMTVPQVGAERQRVVERREQRVAELEKKLAEASTEVEREALREQIEIEQNMPLPPDFSEAATLLNSRTFLPFSIGAAAVLLGLGLVLFVASIGLFFRFRWSRKLFAAVCVGVMVWLLAVVVAFTVRYNRLLGDTVAALVYSFDEPTEADQEVQELTSRMFRRNFLVFELVGGTFGLFYFSLMLFLVLRPEVKADVERKLPKDLMDWEHLDSEKRFSGGNE